MFSHMDKSHILNELKKYYKFESNTDFASFLGISPQNLSNWYARNTIDYDLIYTKCENIDGDWLLSGEGEMLKNDKRTIHRLPSEANFSEGGIYYRSKRDIPLLSIEAIAGFGNSNFMIQDQDIQALYKVPDFNNIDFMIRVKGNSMYPKYSSGDVIACRILRDSKFIEWNKPHLISTTEHGLLVKRLRKSHDKNCLTAISDNKEYDQFEIPLNEVTGIAIIIGVIRLE